MAPVTLIPDASVLVKLGLKEPDRHQAVRLRDLFIAGEVDMVVPPLVYYEAANAFLTSPGRGDTPVADLLEHIYALELEEVAPSKELMARAAATAERIGSSAYDATYLVIAEERNGVMVTADKKFALKARSRHVGMLAQVHAELAGS